VKGQRADLVDRTIVPDVILPPHAAVLDFTFLHRQSISAEYRNRSIPRFSRIVEPLEAAWVFGGVRAVQEMEAERPAARFS